MLLIVIARQLFLNRFSPLVLVQKKFPFAEHLFWHEMDNQFWHETDNPFWLNLAFIKAMCVLVQKKFPFADHPFWHETDHPF